MPTNAISFGDNVKVLDAPETRESGVAGCAGQVYGLTTPSVTSVEVIGTLSADLAVNVHFADTNRSLWFSAELLELVDHAPGTEIRLDGVPKKWTRQSDGSWLEEPAAATASRPWWRFW